MIQREIEKAGIPTIGITIQKQFTEKVKPPRSIYLRWPYGHPLGEPFKVKQHMAVLKKAFEAFESIESSGEIIDIPFKWKREKYD